MENERPQKRQKRPVAAYCGSPERQQKASASLEPSEMEVMETVELKTTEIEMEDIHEETDEDEEYVIIPDIDSEDSNTPLAVETVELKTIEIEMEDIHEETDEDEEDEIIPDIDSVDLNNPPAVVEYVEAIHELYWKTEDLSCMDPDYMSRQPDIDEKMRGLLIDLLVEVQFTLELLDETLFLTVNMIDHFLAIQNVARKKLPLVGVAALLLSCKHVEAAVPVVEDLMFICDRAYPRAELLQMESFIVDTLQFYILVPTPYVFMMRFLKAAQAGEELGLLSLFLVELCLTEYKMLQFRPSLLAAAAIFTAQCTRDGIQYWSECCEVQSRYTQEQLLECSRLMVELHQKAGQGKLLAVHRKFHTPKYGCVSKYEPARFLLDTV